MIQLSELEQRRLDNIQRNNSYLQSIGLASSSIPPTSSSSSSSTGKRKRRKPSSSSSSEDQVIIGTTSEVKNLRRSSRVANLTPVNYKEDSLLLKRQTPETTFEERKENSEEELERNWSLKRQKLLIEGDIDKGTFLLGSFQGEDEENEQKSSTISSLDSIQNLSANLSLFLQDYLGKPVEDYGKAAIMSLSNNGKLPKFNKYPGVSEWKNCLYLWVNIGGKSGYVNTFSEEGRFMMWFDSKSTLRLIDPRNKSPNGAIADDEVLNRPRDNESNLNRVLLFVRLENEGYGCLGELKYVAINLEVHPIQFKWELMQFQNLSKMDYFQRILRENNNHP